MTRRCPGRKPEEGFTNNWHNVPEGSLTPTPRPSGERAWGEGGGCGSLLRLSLYCD